MGVEEQTLVRRWERITGELIDEPRVAARVLAATRRDGAAEEAARLRTGTAMYCPVLADAVPALLFSTGARRRAGVRCTGEV